MSAPASVTPRTVIEAFLPARDPVDLALVYDTANAAGVDDQPVRLAIRRMIAAGEVAQSGRGRRGTLTLTESGRARLERDRLAIRLALAQDEGLVTWDGRWHLVAVSAPESERATRDAIRRRLVDAGAAAIGTSLYLSPHDLADLVDQSHRVHLVRAAATEVDVRGVTDSKDVTELLWPAEPIVAGYAALQRTLSALRSRPEASAEQVLAKQLRLAEALERSMRPDPLIPLELRPEAWAPTLLRQQWLAEWTRLSGLLPDDVLYRGWQD